MVARRDGRASARTSLDLGLTTIALSLGPDGAKLPDGSSLSWKTIERIDADEAACFLLREGEPEKLYLFSDLLDRPYSLMPTAGAPTIVNAGFTMHRIVGTEPYRDTRQKIRAIAPIRGAVLDTATGLGYTAIEAARTADHVITIEIDPTVLALARLNPWSRGLFDNPKITQVIADALEKVQSFGDASFDRIIHDPPTVSLAGDLYSGECYRHLHRLLRRGGRLFHYVGNLDSTQGRRVAAGAVRRLKAAGFERVVRCSDAFGLVAVKS